MTSLEAATKVIGDRAKAVEVFDAIRNELSERMAVELRRITDEWIDDTDVREAFDLATAP